MLRRSLVFPLLKKLICSVSHCWVEYKDPDSFSNLPGGGDYYLCRFCFRCGRIRVEYIIRSNNFYSVGCRKRCKWYEDFLQHASIEELLVSDNQVERKIGLLRYRYGF